MFTLNSDEKSAGVMVYTQNNFLVCGEVVTRQSNRVSVWLRTEGAPEYLHLLKPQVVSLNGHAVKSLSYSQLYLPTNQVIGFHLTPPASDPLDYDESEKYRTMQPVTLLVGTFIFNGSIRISTHADPGTSITSARTVWMSVYDVKISNPLLSQMGEVKVPMLLVRPLQVGFALGG
jgi:hypothetical protein